jgi:hypothetical protein
MGLAAVQGDRQVWRRAEDAERVLQVQTLQAKAAAEALGMRPPLGVSRVVKAVGQRA